MVFEQRMSWTEFKNSVASNSDTTEWIYRGHASERWLLETTLYRFLKKRGKIISANEYYSLLRRILANEGIRKHPDFTNLILPERNPFIIGTLVGNDQHKEDFKIVFHLMIKLRQLGFPSPLLDGTRNPYMAVFFALSNTEIDECASIIRVKSTPEFNPFGLRIDISDFYFSATDLSGLRHDRQESVYLLAIQHEHADTVVSRDNRRGPMLHLAGHEEFALQNVVIEKYVISDSKESRLEILEELYNRGLSFEAIYGESHLLENTLLKDLAINEILFNNKTKSIPLGSN